MRYLPLLFWLKWKLMWRGYRRNISAAFGVIVAILAFLPMALGIAWVCGLGFRGLHPPYNEHLLRGVLLGIYLFWLLSPLIGYALSESYDITKLLVYPLTARQLFIGTIAGSLIDFPVLLLLPTLIAALVGFSQSLAAFLLVLPAVALFLFHTLSLSQAIILASAGVLRSRRFRDLVMVLIPLFWIGYYVLSRTLTRQMAGVDWASFVRSRTWELLNFLPPGFAARSIAAAGRGEYGLSLGYLAGLLVFSGGTVYLAGWLIEKLYAGDVVSPAVRKRAPRAATGRRGGPVPLAPSPARPVAAPTARPLFGVRLPPVVEAVVDKELKYILRDPYFKIALMNLLYMLVVAAFAFLGGPEREGMGSFRPAMVWAATGLVILAEMQLPFNMFGTEGGAAAVLFLFPSSRRQILLGKNLTLFAALSVVNLVFIGLLAAFAGALEMFGPLFCWMELALVVFIAAGNLVSIWFPFRVVMRGWRIQQQSAGRGCGYGFLYLAISGAAFVLLLPILAALLAPTFWVSPAWHALGIPLALAYATGLYALSLHLAEPLLLQRELVLIERLGQEE
jgi:ABC-2 type transport system permease protein